MAIIEMTREEFEKKYGYEPLKGISQLQQEVEQPKTSGLQRAAGITDAIFGSGKIGEAIGTQKVKQDVLGGNYNSGFDYSKLSSTARQRMEQKGIPTTSFGEQQQIANTMQSPTKGQLVGSGLQSALLFTPVGRAAKGITAGVRALGMKRGVSAIGKIGTGLAEGYGFDTALNLQQGKTGFETLDAGFGTAIGGAIPGLGVAKNVAGRVGQKVLPKLLSYTSDVPEEAFRTMLARRGPVTQAIKSGANPMTALTNTQGAVRQLRKDLTREWQESQLQLADEFTGKNMGLSDKSTRQMEKLADEFGFNLPQNMKSASVIEWMDTLKSMGELPKMMLSVSPKGAALRKAKDALKQAVVKNFGGEGGSVANLYKNYSSKKGVFDAANDIVRAYSTGKPIQQTTALNRLQTLFNENKPAYLEAILDLEKITGRDLLSEITASKFANKLPTGGSAVSATSGILAPTGILDKAIKLLLLPLSSPRSAGFITRTLGKGGESGPIRGLGDVLLDTKAGQKFEKGVVDYAKDPQLGMGIRNVGKPKAIDELTKREMSEAVDYIDNNIIGKNGEYNQKIEENIGYLAEKFGIKSKDYKTIANKLEDLIDNTKTIGGERKVLSKSNFTKTPDGKFSGSVGAYKGEKDLTTKLLKDLEGKTTVSKQYILDATNRGELKQVERDLIRQTLANEGDTINVSDFAKKVKAELLPLKIGQSGMKRTAYENITLPSELRGKVKNYDERIYSSPIKTSAGSVHYGGEPNYFGHTRIEDMADNQTRRVIEVQSDLYQKGGLEREQGFGDIVSKTKRDKEVSKLRQYNDRTAHFRMIREEIKKAAQDGKTKLQFPTGETAMKIEGLGGENLQTTWITARPRRISSVADDVRDFRLSPEKMKVGLEVQMAGQPNANTWIITDVLGDGKFKAVPKNRLTEIENRALSAGQTTNLDFSNHQYLETFDISGKVDTNNPIYKFYEKDVQNYLKKFGGKRIVDDKGVSWIEVPIKKEWAKMPVEAFALLAIPNNNENGK